MLVTPGGEKGNAVEYGVILRDRTACKVGYVSVPANKSEDEPMCSDGLF